MSDFRTVVGFEEVWRAPAGRRRTPQTVLRPGAPPMDARARLARLARRAPEVMVKVTGRTRDPAHLAAHLDYVSRNGEIELEDPDGWPISGRTAVRDLAEDWSAAALANSGRRANTPFSLSLVLSMPAGTDPFAVRDAARTFAARTFGDRFEYVFALHTDTPRPHVHVSVRSQGARGDRLNPKKAELETWRQIFAEALRERGVEAEATPRRARGVTRKAERMPIRQIRERLEAGRGPAGRVHREAHQRAARAAFGGEQAPTVWERRSLARQQQVRALYLAQARLLQASAVDEDRRLGLAVEAFVRGMPAPDSERLAIARQLRVANARLEREPPAQRDPPRPGPGRDKAR